MGVGAGRDWGSGASWARGGGAVALGEADREVGEVGMVGDKCGGGKFLRMGSPAVGVGVGGSPDLDVLGFMPGGHGGDRVTSEADSWTRLTRNSPRQALSVQLTLGSTYQPPRGFGTAQGGLRPVGGCAAHTML